MLAFSGLVILWVTAIAPEYGDRIAVRLGAEPAAFGLDRWGGPVLGVTPVAMLTLDQTVLPPVNRGLS